MATLNDLRTAIDNLLSLGAAKQLLQLNSNTAERAYEAYVLALCCKAVRKAGGRAVMTGINSGANPPVLVFRGGPGAMYSKKQDFCYADCTIGSARFEIHVDVEYVGQSGASHEIDVSIYKSDRAADARSSRSSPRTNSSLIGAIECKFYSSTPGVALARTFVGLVSDCSTNRVESFVSNKTTDGIDMFMAPKSKPDPFNGLSPLDQDSEDEFVFVTSHQLKQWSRTL